jgi:hypothetical protein
MKFVDEVIVMFRTIKCAAVLGLVLAVNPLVAFAEELLVYKSPTCGCCVKWIDHLEDYGFTASIDHPADLDGVKKKLGISAQTASCHTAVSEQGFVFEGHIPGPVIQAFLASPPEQAIGLAVPAMPMGSPGMEMGDMFQPYKVFQINEDGTLEVYASIDESNQQY